jgi:hypothetical protein
MDSAERGQFFDSRRDDKLEIEVARERVSFYCERIERRHDLTGIALHACHGLAEEAAINGPGSGHGDLQERGELKKR